MPICPECGFRVSPQERDCPDCGHHLPRRKKAPSGSRQQTPRRNQASSQSSATNNGSKVAIVVGSVIGGMVVVGVLLFFLVTKGNDEVGADGELAENHFRTDRSPFSAARSARSKNSLKQVAIGIHNYHDRHRVFPPGRMMPPKFDAVHGWGSLLLPYVEQDAIYRAIDFKQDWDSPANRPHMKQPVQTYLSAGINKTVDDQGFALSHWSLNAQLFNDQRDWSMRFVTDGTSNTLMGGEAGGNWKPWGHPDNLRDPAQVGINTNSFGFGAPGAEGAIMLFVDGSVRTIKSTVKPELLRNLSNPSDGQTINFNEL